METRINRHDELKVWVDGFQRVVCGINDKTTVQEVVIALAQATGQTGRYTLVERWRNSERLLPPSECPLGILNKWGQYAGDVQFVLRRSPDSKGANGGVSANLSGSGPSSGGIQAPSLKQQTSSGSIQSQNYKYVQDFKNIHDSLPKSSFQQYQPISNATLPNHSSLPNHYNQLRQNSTLSAQALKNHQTTQSLQKITQISAPVQSGNTSHRHQAHVKKIEQDIEQHARLEYYKVIGGQQTGLDELETQLNKFNSEITKLDTAIRSYELKRLHSSSSVASSNVFEGSKFHQRSGSAPLAMDKQPITLNSTLQLKQQEIANLEHQIRENEKFLSAHDLFLKKPGSVQDMLGSLTSDINKNNSSIDQVLHETHRVLHNLGDGGRVSANTENFVRHFGDQLGKIEDKFKTCMSEITKSERITTGKGDQLDELNQQLRRTGLNNFIQKHQSNNSNNNQISRMLAPPKEFAPNTRNYDHNVDTASVAVAVGQKLSKHASDPPDKPNQLHGVNQSLNSHKYYNNRMLPESGGDSRAPHGDGGDKLEGVWV